MMSQASVPGPGAVHAEGTSSPGLLEGTLLSPELSFGPLASRTRRKFPSLSLGPPVWSVCSQQAQDSTSLPVGKQGTRMVMSLPGTWV